MTKYKIPKGERIWLYRVHGDITDTETWRLTDTLPVCTEKDVVYTDAEFVSELEETSHELIEQGYRAFRLPINDRNVDILLVQKESITIED